MLLNGFQPQLVIPIPGYSSGRFIHTVAHEMNATLFVTNGTRIFKLVLGEGFNANPRDASL